MDTSGLIPISHIIDNLLNELGDYSQQNYIRYMAIAERGLKELNIFHLNNVSTKILQVDQASKSAQLPSDYLRHSRIGILLGNGRVYPLTRDPNLNLAKKDECGVEQADPMTTLSDDNQIYTSRGGYSEAGRYRINTKKNRIELDQGVSASELIIEYSSSGILVDGITYVPLLAEEALIAWVIWKVSPIGTAQRERAKIDYGTELIKLKDSMMPSMDEMIDSLLQSKTQVK
jgi:hypothetical protein